MSKLLIQETPLQVLPSLAVVIGLNEAIALQQIHYQLQRTGGIGEVWVRGSIPTWRAMFPFWSERTVRRIFDNLAKRKLIKATDVHNADKTDHTYWYTVDYDEVEKLEAAPRLYPYMPIVEAAKVTASNEAAKVTASIKGIDSLEGEAAQIEQANLREVKTAYERWIGPLTPMLVEQLKEACATNRVDWIVEALELTQKRFVEKDIDRPSLAYALGIVRSWMDDGYDGGNALESMTPREKADMAALGIDV